ncbi:MAG TPA: transposase [Nitrospira sp.]|nr:transposase [Nitrospira sp.]
MSKLNFSQDQVKAIVSELNAGQMPGKVSRRHGVSVSTLYRWRAKFVTEQPSYEKERLRSLEGEHRRLKQQLAELALDYATLRAALIRDVRGDC